MGNGMKMLLVLALMFGGIYLFSISHRYIKAAKRKRVIERKRKKREKFKNERMRLQSIREEKARLIELRREEIKQHFNWLEGMNKMIKIKQE